MLRDTTVAEQGRHESSMPANWQTHHASWSHRRFRNVLPRKGEALYCTLAMVPSLPGFPTCIIVSGTQTALRWQPALPSPAQPSTASLPRADLNHHLILDPFHTTQPTQPSKRINSQCLPARESKRLRRSSLSFPRTIARRKRSTFAYALTSHASPFVSRKLSIA